MIANYFTAQFILSLNVFFEIENCSRHETFPCLADVYCISDK